MKLDEWQRFCERQRRDISTGERLSDSREDLDSSSCANQPECLPHQALDLVHQAQGTVESRIIVRITVRKCGILQDPDNGLFKPLVDQLRYANIISEDNPGTIKLETEQVRVKTKAEEGTEVVIIYP